jgi:hypothetical protein
MNNLKQKLVLFLVLIAFHKQQANAQTISSADEVFEKYLTAIGGKERIKQIKDMYIESTFPLNSETDNGMGRVTNTRSLPSKTLVIASTTTGEEIQRTTCDGSRIRTKGYHRIYDNKTYQGGLANGWILTNSLFPELYYKDLGLKATFNGIEKVNLYGIKDGVGDDAYKITFSTVDGSVSWSTFYDTKTFYKVQMSAPRRIIEYGIEPQQRSSDHVIQEKYLDYKDFGGLKYPSKYKKYPNTVLVTKVEINKKPDDSVFKVE